MPLSPGKHVRFKIDPRMVSPEKVARRLGITVPAFENKLPELLAAGFPAVEPITGNYVLEAVDRWINRVGELDEAAEMKRANAEMLKQIRSAPWKK